MADWIASTLIVFAVMAGFAIGRLYTLLEQVHKRLTDG